jgi:hypothetical protein
LPRVGQWNMMNKVTMPDLSKLLSASSICPLFTRSQALLHIFSSFSLTRKWSMVVESGAGCVSISLETCKTVLLPDSVVNSRACAKPQEWQVFLKCFKIYLLSAHVISFSLYLLFTTVTVLLSIVGLCSGACSSGYIRASRSSGASSES